MSTKQMRVLFLLATMFAIASCGGALDQRPTIAEDYLRKLIAEQSKDKIELMSFEKMDGVEREIAGAQTYVLEFKAVVKIKERLHKDCGGGGCDCWESFHVHDKQKSGWAGCERKQLRANYQFQLLGELHMLKSDNGWRVEHLNITSHENLGGGS